jgi:hypothetical protein
MPQNIPLNIPLNILLKNICITCVDYFCRTSVRRKRADTADTHLLQLFGRARVATKAPQLFVRVAKQVATPLGRQRHLDRLLARVVERRLVGLKLDHHSFVHHFDCAQSRLSCRVVVLHVEFPLDHFKRVVWGKCCRRFAVEPQPFEPENLMQPVNRPIALGERSRSDKPVVAGAAWRTRGRHVMRVWRVQFADSSVATCLSTHRSKRERTQFGTPNKRMQFGTPNKRTHFGTPSKRTQFRTR